MLPLVRATLYDMLPYLWKTLINERGKCYPNTRKMLP